MADQTSKPVPAEPDSSPQIRSGAPSPPVGGLSVDVEDYYHVEAFADWITPEMWPQFPSRVVENTHRVLDLLGRLEVRATFFVLGIVAEKEPGLVRDIVAAGHELGCHSYLHRRIWKLTPEEFREDTRRALRAVEDAVGQRVTGYRAPTFSVVRKSLWAIEILAQEGFLYDSSVFPIRHDLYGMPEVPRFPFQWECGDGRTLYEIPPLTVRILGRNLPVAGGGYLRLLPMWYTRWALRRIEEREHESAVVYFHPWELDTEQPRLAGKWKSRLRHYVNLRQMEGRIVELARERRFVPLRDYLQRHLARGPLPKRSVASESSPGQ